METIDGDGSFVKDVSLPVSVTSVTVTSVTVIVLVTSWGLLLAEEGGAGLEGGGSGLLGMEKSPPPILDVELRGLRTNVDWSSLYDKRCDPSELSDDMPRGKLLVDCRRGSTERFDWLLFFRISTLLHTNTHTKIFTVHTTRSKLYVC